MDFSAGNVRNLFYQAGGTDILRILWKIYASFAAHNQQADKFTQIINMQHRPPVCYIRKYRQRLCHSGKQLIIAFGMAAIYHGRPENRHVKIL